MEKAKLQAAGDNGELISKHSCSRHWLLRRAVMTCLLPAARAMKLKIQIRIKNTRRKSRCLSVPLWHQMARAVVSSVTEDRVASKK